MVRVYYIGAAAATDPRLAGVPLEYGQAVDVPEELAEELLREPHYAEEMQPSVGSVPASGVEMESEAEPVDVEDGDQEDINGNDTE